jgi:hypothetical protein
MYVEQNWHTFKEAEPVLEDTGYGPSGMDLWIYYPQRDYVTEWHNWSGCDSDIKELIKEKALWCFAWEPLSPVTKGKK